MSVDRNRAIMAQPNEETPLEKIIQWMMQAMGQAPTPGATLSPSGVAPASLTTPAAATVQPGAGLFDNLGTQLGLNRPQMPALQGQAELEARQAAERTALQARMAGTQRTPLETATTQRADILRATPNETLLDPQAASVIPETLMDAEDVTGPEPSKYGQYGADMAGGTKPVGPGAAAAGGSFQGGSGVNTGTRSLDPNATYGAPSVIPKTGPFADNAGSGAPGSLTGLPALGSLDATLRGRAGSEGVLAQYMKNPGFAVYDMLVDAGANPSENIYAQYALQKYEPIFDAMAAISQAAGPKGQTNAYGEFIRKFAGGADLSGDLKSLVAKAQGTGEEAERARAALRSIPASQISAVISAQKGESPWAAGVRKQSAARAEMEGMRSAQGRAQKGDLTNDQAEWLRYLMGELG